MWEGSAGTGEGDDVKRHLFIAAVFLLAGAVVNVAVAWGCALWSTLEGPTRRGALSEQPNRWEITWLHGFGAARTEWRVAYLSGEVSQVIQDAFNQSRRSLSDDYAKIAGNANASKYEYSSDLLPSWGRERFEEPSAAPRRVHVYEDARGWPALALWSSYDSVYQRNKGHALVGQRHAIALWGMDTRWSEPFRDVKAIPIAPIWVGFAVNTLFYAALLLLPFVLRRIIRLKRGRCPACAYPMGESAVCSECGKALPQRVKAAT